MKNSLLKIAEKLDKEGKFALADKIDNFIKTSQFFLQPTTGVTPTAPQLGSPMFNVMSGYEQTGGPLQKLYSGAGADALQRVQSGQNPYVIQTPGGAMGLFQTLGMAGQGPEAAEYATKMMAGLGAQIGAAQTGATLAKFQSLMKYYRNTLLAQIKENPLRARANYKQGYEEPIKTFLEEVLSAENDFNTLNGIIAQLKQDFGVIGVDETIQNAVTSSMQRLLLSLYMNPTIEASTRYNNLFNLPILRPYMSQFGPQPIQGTQQQMGQFNPSLGQTQQVTQTKTKKPVQQATDIKEKKPVQQATDILG